MQWEKRLQILDLQGMNIQNIQESSHNLTASFKKLIKIGKGPEQTVFYRRHTNAQWADKFLNITSHQGNANQSPRTGFPGGSVVNTGACTAQLLSLRCRAQELPLLSLVPQPLKPEHSGACAPHKRSHCNEKPMYHDERVAHAPCNQRKGSRSNEDPAQPNR